MELQTAAKAHPKSPGTDQTQRNLPSAAIWTLAIFLAAWCMFLFFSRELPYVKNGSDVIFHSKLHFEKEGRVFPSNPHLLRVMTFGDSKMLAGFMPKLFDRLAASHDQSVYSFNSGFPGTAVFLPQLKTICRTGQAPDVLLLQYPWGNDPPQRNLFHVILNDHTVVADLFPFREFARDATDFLMTARTHGGIRKLYRDSQANGHKVIADKGYYLITEQSRFPSGRLPEDFHLATDTPNAPQPRKIPPPNSESRELQALLLKHHMRCFVVPFYLRIGEAAAPAADDPKFAAVVESATSCKVLGPDYFLYPNRDFSDQTHLNADGARAYTQALFQLLQKPLSEGSQGAVQ